jgi:hypothetical protein
MVSGSGSRFMVSGSRIVNAESGTLNQNLDPERGTRNRAEVLESLIEPRDSPPKGFHMFRHPVALVAVVVLPGV